MKILFKIKKIQSFSNILDLIAIKSRGYLVKLEVAQKIVNSLNESECEKLKKAHWRYMHFIDIIEDPNLENVEQAKEDRKTYAHLLTLSIFDVEKSIQFMMSITGLPSDYCEAWGEHDFFEVYGISSEDAEKRGYA